MIFFSFLYTGSFGFDEDTMASNAFQKADIAQNYTAQKLQQKALEQFDDTVNLLRKNGISIVVFNDPAVPPKPDAIFPNNWFSTHHDGSVIIYPMMASSRRLEQRMDIIKYLEDVYKVDTTLFHKSICPYVHSHYSLFICTHNLLNMSTTIRYFCGILQST